MYPLFSKKIEIHGLIKPSKESFKHFFKYIYLSYSCGVTYFVEFFIFEFLSIIAGQFNYVILGTYIVIANIGVLILKISLAISNTFATFIGNSLGNNEIHLTKYLLRLGYITYYIIFLFLALFLGFLYPYIFKLFTHDSKILEHSKQFRFFFLMYIFLDGFHFYFEAFLRSIGEQKINLLYFVFAYYFIGGPLSYIMAIILKLEIWGLLTGFMIGELAFILISQYKLSRINLELQYEKIHKQLEH